MQSKRDELVNERKNVNNVFSKISLKSNYKGHADKRKELENKFSDLSHHECVDFWEKKIKLYEWYKGIFTICL